MKKNDVKFSEDKFKSFARYMIQAAEHKRRVPYYELENIYGLNHKQVGHYSGVLGEYCIKRRLPLLNGLVISSTECIPGEGFDYFHETTGMDWGHILHTCWKRFHVTTSREKQSENYRGLDPDIKDFLDNKE